MSKDLPPGVAWFWIILIALVSLGPIGSLLLWGGVISVLAVTSFAILIIYVPAVLVVLGLLCIDIYSLKTKKLILPISAPECSVYAPTLMSVKGPCNVALTSNTPLPDLELALAKMLARHWIPTDSEYAALKYWIVYHDTKQGSFLPEFIQIQRFEKSVASAKSKMLTLTPLEKTLPLSDKEERLLKDQVVVLSLILAGLLCFGQFLLGLVTPRT